MTALGLGTVQFGIGYGVTNLQGRVPLAEVADILRLARNAGVDLLDTACLYGISETVLGKCGVADFRVVTKTPRFGSPSIQLDHVKMLRESFEHSLTNLRLPGVYGLLIHHAPDLLAPGGDGLMETMRTLRQLGLVTKIGASVYNGFEIDALIDQYEDIDLIQLPLNVLDQRLIEGGQIERLKDRGIEVHARSIFLQGLLLVHPENIPRHLDRLVPNLNCWASSVKNAGVTCLQASLGFVRSVSGIDAVIVGVTDRKEFVEILYAFEHAAPFPGVGVACNDPDLVDPSRWGKPNDSIV